MCVTKQSKCNSLLHPQALGGSLNSSPGDTITTVHTPICTSPHPTVYLIRYLLGRPKLVWDKVPNLVEFVLYI